MGLVGAVVEMVVSAQTVGVAAKARSRSLRMGAVWHKKARHGRPFIPDYASMGIYNMSF